MGIEEQVPSQEGLNEGQDTEVTLKETLKAMKALKALEDAKDEMFAIQGELEKDPFAILENPQNFQEKLEGLALNVTSATEAIQTLYDLGLRFNPVFLGNVVEMVPSALFNITALSLSLKSGIDMYVEDPEKRADYIAARISVEECELGLGTLEMYVSEPGLILDPDLSPDQPTDDPEINFAIKGEETVRSWLDQNS
jgi:hypothetical protein